MEQLFLRRAPRKSFFGEGINGQVHGSSFKDAVNLKKKMNGAIQLRGETVLGEILQSGESVQKLFLQRAPFNNVLKSYQCHYSWHYFQGCWK